MLGLKNYLLPQLEEGNDRADQSSTDYLLSLCGLSLVAVLAGLVWFRKTNKIKVFSCLATLPFFGKLIQIYLTAYYARSGEFDWTRLGPDADCGFDAGATIAALSGDWTGPGAVAFQWSEFS